MCSSMSEIVVLKEDKSLYDIKPRNPYFEPAQFQGMERFKLLQINPPCDHKLCSNPNSPWQ